LALAAHARQIKANAGLGGNGILVDCNVARFFADAEAHYS
jgi:hypothetical protein